MQLLLLLLGFADVSVAGVDTGVGCDGPRMRALAEAVDHYCRESAAPSEALGCRVARYSFTVCEAAPVIAGGDEGELSASIRDPRDRSYAWLLRFAPRHGRFLLERFVYEYDDCDAMGVPAPPRGKLRLADLRRGPDDRD